MSSSRLPSSCLSLLRQQGSGGTRNGVPSSSAVRCFSTSPMSAQAPAPRRVKPASYEGIDFQPPRTIIEQIERYPRHPLNAFFPTIKYEVPVQEKGFKKDGTPEKTTEVEGPAALDPAELRGMGARRAWKASELRRKSSVELHQLWYILLFERNRLLTSWGEVVRVTSKMLAQQMLNDSIGAKLKHVKRSMIRIKFVLNERRVALLDAHEQEMEAQAAEEAKAAAKPARIPSKPAKEAATAEKVQTDEAKVEAAKQPAVSSRVA